MSGLPPRAKVDDMPLRDRDVPTRDQPPGRKLQSQASLARSTQDVVPEYNESKPEEMAMDIDRKVSFLRSQSIDPRFDRSRPEAERMQFMPDAPAADSQYNSLGMEGFHNSSNGPRGSNGAPAVEWLPYSNVREKLESWVQPGASNDVGSGRNLMKQFSKDERT